MTGNREITASGQAGFTLLEVLAAVAIMTIMLGSARMALRLMSGAAARGATHADQLDMVARGLAAVRNDLTRIQRITRIERRKLSFQFDGDARRMRFVLIEPAYPSDPGSYLVTYSVRGGGAQAQLVRSRDIFDPGQTSRPAERDDAAEVVVMHGPYRFEFAYLSRAGLRTEWLPKWTDGLTMPELIRLRVTATAPDMPALPDLVVRPRIDAEITCLGVTRHPCSTKTGRLEEGPDPRSKSKEATPR